jgi:hypothetical protein
MLIYHVSFHSHITLSSMRANFGKVANRLATMQRARGDQDNVEMRSGTYVEGDWVVCRSLEESFFILKHDETVNRLYLLSCKIGNLGAKAIAEALKHNETVEFLELSENHIGDDGAEELIDALSSNVFIGCLPVWSNKLAPEARAVIKYLTETRNKILIPAAVRCASLSLIAARRNIADAGNFAIFPKEIVKMIAMEVYATRKDPIWINALTESERTGKSDD